jgi:hypothetical protein
VDRSVLPEGIVSIDTRLNHVRILLEDALQTTSSTYMRALIVEAKKQLTAVLED